MKESVLLKQPDITLPQPIRFSPTYGSMDTLSRQPGKAISIMRELSMQSTLVFIKKGKDSGNDTFKLFTGRGVYSCVFSKDGESITMTHFAESTLKDQNSALVRGLRVSVPKHIIVQINLQRAYNCFLDYENGMTLEGDARKEKVDVSGSVQMLRKAIFSLEREEDEEEEKPQIHENLKGLLEIAEFYADCASEIEKAKAQEIGNITYSSVKAAETYNRIDRIAYRFGVNNLDENAFKSGTQVVIENRQGEEVSGEIVKLIKDGDKPATAIDILFSNQVSINDFASSGVFSLSVSDTIVRTQKGAIQKIREGRAKSEYMNRVLGEHRPAGYDNKDLRNVKKKLREKEYPPNESQMRAIEKGINTKDVFLVMGPPGTGKTTVILEWVKYFVLVEHKRVLVSSQNNKAVDNVLARIGEEKNIDVMRIGSEAKLQDNVKPFLTENRLRQLRQDIRDAYADNREQIRDLISTWDQYAESAGRLPEILQREMDARREFEEAVLSRLSPAYRGLEKMISDFSRLQKRIIDTDTSIQKKDQAIFKYERRKEGILKKILSILYKHNLRKRDELEALYRELRNSEKESISEYRRKKKEYDALFTRIRRTYYEEYYCRKQEAQDEKEALQNLIKTDDNIWGLYKSISSMQVNKPEDVYEITTAVQRERDRAISILDVISEWNNAQEKQNYALENVLFESVDLVGATCVGVSSKQKFQNLSFDVTIIDEAGQIQIHNALIPMSVSEKLIMLGDHKQIPPTADTEMVKYCEASGMDDDLLKRSLFEVMYEALPDNRIMLDTQYRMPAEIADILSKWFYEGNYKSLKTKRKMTGALPFLSVSPFVIIDTSKDPKRYERRDPGAGSDNELEAWIAAKILIKIKEDGEIPLSEVGVIAAYKLQVARIQNALKGPFSQDETRELVATLDSYQGQERDIILYSFVKSSKKNANKSRIGFLSELRRLNVAMSRCKKTLVMIGDMDFLTSCQYSQKDADEKAFSEFMRLVVAAAQEMPEGVISSARFKAKMRGTK